MTGAELTVDASAVVPILETPVMAHELSAWAASHPWILVAVTLASALGSIALVCVAAVRIPQDYFTCEDQPLPCAGRSLTVRIAARVFLNLVGAGLIAFRLYANSIMSNSVQALIQ